MIRTLFTGIAAFALMSGVAFAQDPTVTTPLPSSSMPIQTPSCTSCAVA